MSLLVHTLGSRGQLLSAFYEFPELDEFVLFVLLKNPHNQIRREAERGFYRLSIMGMHNNITVDGVSQTLL
jgi:hypothetical protein